MPIWCMEIIALPVNASSGRHDTVPLQLDFSIFHSFIASLTCLHTTNSCKLDHHHH